MMTKRLLIISIGGSRQGGIPEVCRQVESLFSSDPGYSCKVFTLPENRFARKLLELSRLLDIYVNLMAVMGFSIMFMHPHVYGRMRLGLRARNRAFVWAYGIDVWGAYGKKRTTGLSGAKCVLSISSFTSEEVLKNHPDANVRTINITVGHMSASSDKLVEKNAFELLTVGRLSSLERYKGHDLVIEALGLLKQ